MGRKTKTALIVAAILLVAGALTGGIGYLIWDQKWDTLQNMQMAKVVQKEYASSSESLNLIDIDTKNTRISLIPTDAMEVSLSYQTSEEEDYTISEQSGTLKVLYAEKDMPWYRKYGWNLGWLSPKPARDMIVYVPQDYQGDLILKTTNQQIVVEDFAGIENLTAVSSNAAITCTNLSANGNLELLTSNAPIALINIDAKGEINVQTSNAKIQITGALGNQVTAQSSNGSCELKQIEVEGAICIQTKNGAVILEEAVGTRIWADTSNAKIIAERIRASEIELSTKNENIEGSIVGAQEDYQIIASAKNGKNTLGEKNTGNKKLHITTKNGDIQMEFVR